MLLEMRQDVSAYAMTPTSTDTHLLGFLLNISLWCVARYVQSGHQPRLLQRHGPVGADGQRPGRRRRRPPCRRHGPHTAALLARRGAC